MLSFIRQMNDDQVHEAIGSLLVAAESLIDGQHPSSPDDVAAQVALGSTRDIVSLLGTDRRGDPEWDGLSELADAVRLVVAARRHGSPETQERLDRLAGAVRQARGLLRKS